MTKEEKIAELINIRDNYNYTLAPREVFDDAIKALEQQPCEDCISRESVIEWLKDKDIIKTKNQEENARRELAELSSVTPRTNLAETSQDYKTELKSQMLKYGFKAPDMTVTEFVEDCLPPVKLQPCEDAMFFKIIKDIEESDEQQVSYNEEFQLSKYAYVINNAETFKEMGYQVINEESVFGFDTVYLKRNKKVDDLQPVTPQRPNRCDSCTHSEEQDGSNCYECVKGMADNFEAQSTEMRDATEEERKSVKDYIESISKPTGVHFYESQPTDTVSRSEAITELTALIENFKGIQGDMGSAINSARELIKSLPSVTPQRPKGKWIFGKCNRCGGNAPCPPMASGYYSSAYCPDCGAEMSGGGEDEE